LGVGKALCAILFDRERLKSRSLQVPPADAQLCNEVLR
jgi:hypothetical protein